MRLTVGACSVGVGIGACSVGIGAGVGLGGVVLVPGRIVGVRDAMSCWSLRISSSCAFRLSVPLPAVSIGAGKLFGRVGVTVVGGISSPVGCCGDVA